MPGFSSTSSMRLGCTTILCPNMAAVAAISATVSFMSKNASPPGRGRPRPHLPLSMRHRDRSRYVFGRLRISQGRSVPYAAAVCRDVDLRFVVRIWNHAVSPLKVIAANARPVCPAIGRAIGCGVEAADIQHVGVSRIDSDIINVLRMLKY